MSSKWSSFRVTSIKTDFTAKFKFALNNVLFKTRYMFREERTIIRVYTNTNYVKKTGRG